LADLVVYGIGVLPNAELAADAGLRVANGICVDAQLLTDDPAISAIGDAASFPRPEPNAIRDVVLALDHEGHPIDCSVRLNVGDKFGIGPPS
jgi:NADPH-dependent 2,4-dienoyl-CoA reductase/sulfur reductase-like enzyme